MLLFRILLLTYYNLFFAIYHNLIRVHSGSVVECLTQDRGAAGLSLTSVSVLCPWARHIYPCLVLVLSTQEDPSWHNWKIVGLDVKNHANQTNKSQPYWQILTRVCKRIKLYRLYANSVEICWWAAQFVIKLTAIFGLEKYAAGNMIIMLAP